MGHSTDSCPILQEDGAEQVNMAGGVPVPHRQYDPYSNTYNPGWRDHPNFSYGNRPQNAFSNRPQDFSNHGNRNRNPHPPTREVPWRILSRVWLRLPPRSSKRLDSSSRRPGMKDMEARISQMAIVINRLESHVYEKLPSQPEANPEMLKKTKRAEKEKEILDVFRKIQINIPLLDVIKQVPKYAKFLKDLCVNKRKLRGDERVMVRENVSAVLQRKLPPKCGDPGSLKETGIIIQLADRTCAYPDGIVEDVLVQVDGLIFPADFYVLYMDDRSAPNPSPIILGRPFLSTAQTKIDVSKVLTMPPAVRIQAENQAAFFAHIGFTPLHPPHPPPP
nr:uncharacterized protein LOC113714106 [Coffea arabica]